MKVAKKIHTIMCDDIRHEQGGKISLMGIYSKDIIFSELPAILPRLCLAIFLEGIKEPFANIKVILKAPESDDLILKIPPPQDMQLNDNLQMAMVLSPFRAKVAGEAKFSIYFGHAKNPSLIHKFNIKEGATAKV